MYDKDHLAKDLFGIFSNLTRSDHFYFYFYFISKNKTGQEIKNNKNKKERRNIGMNHTQSQSRMITVQEKRQKIIIE